MKHPVISFGCFATILSAGLGVFSLTPLAKAEIPKLNSNRGSTGIYASGVNPGRPSESGRPSEQASVGSLYQSVLMVNHLIASECTPESVVIFIPGYANQPKCAQPNSTIPSGFYRVHPQTMQLVNLK